MRKASTCWKTCGKDVVRRRCRGKGSLQRRGVSSCVQWKVNGTLPPALFSISMHSSHWLADKVQRSTDCFFFPEPPGGVVPRGEGGRCQRIGPVSRPSGPKVRGLRDRFCPLSLHPLAARLGIPTQVTQQRHLTYAISNSTNTHLPASSSSTALPCRLTKAGRCTGTHLFVGYLWVSRGLWALLDAATPPR